MLSIHDPETDKCYSIFVDDNCGPAQLSGPLLTKYSTYEKARALIDLGDIRRITEDFEQTMRYSYKFEHAPGASFSTQPRTHSYRNFAVGLQSIQYIVEEQAAVKYVYLFYKDKWFYIDRTKSRDECKSYIENFKPLNNMSGVSKPYTYNDRGTLKTTYKNRFLFDEHVPALLAINVPDEKDVFGYPVYYSSILDVDGEPWNAGKILLNSYGSYEDAKKLIDLGDIVSLNSDYEITKQNTHVVIYNKGSDRGEWGYSGPRKACSAISGSIGRGGLVGLELILEENFGIEYIYIFKDNKWIWFYKNADIPYAVKRNKEGDEGYHVL
jgi:hypothetical protein